MNNRETPLHFQTPQSLFGLQNKVCLVTGSSGHLGSQIAAVLAAAGAFVYLNGRDEEKLLLLHQQLQNLGGQSEVLPFDITEDQQVANALKKIASDNGHLDVLINNAFSGSAGKFNETHRDDFVAAYNTGVGSTVTLVNQALELLRAKATPESMSSVINVASMYGMVSPDPGIYGSSGHDNPPSYGAMKAALIQYTRYAATNLAKDNIRVNAISPGAFPRPNVEQSMPDLWNTLNRKQPLNRVGRPEEIQGAVLYLASNASSYVTGTNLVIDGGWTAW